MTELKESLQAEGKSKEKVQTSSPSIKDRIRRLQGITKPNENDQETIHDGVAAAVREEISSTKLKEFKKVPDGMRKETKCQQKKDYLDQEKENGICEDRLHVQVPKHEMTQLEERLLAEDMTDKDKDKHKFMQTSSLKVVTNLKELEERNTKLEDQVTPLKERLPAEERTAKEMQTSFPKAQENRKRESRRGSFGWKNLGNDNHQSKQRLYKAETELENLQHEKKQLEIIQKSLKRQQQQLINEIKDEKHAGEINKQVLTKIVTNLKEEEERSKKLADEVTHFKGLLANEKRKAKEVQTSSTKAETEIANLQHEKKQLEKTKKSLKRQLQQLINEIKDEKHAGEINKHVSTKLNDRIKELEGMRLELEIQQKKLEENLVQEKEKVTKEVRSRVQAEDDRKTLEQRNAMLEKDKEYLIKLLEAEDRNGKQLKESLSKATTTCEKLQKKNEILQKEKEDLSEKLSTKKSNAEIQIASFSEKMNSHTFPGSEKTEQTKDKHFQQSVITESTDSGRGSMHSGLEYQDLFIPNGRQLNTELKVAVTVASKGANMHIPGTGVELDIPTGATRGKVLIEMIILPFDKLDAPVSTFSCNSSIAVELLPNKMEFQNPVRLILPHCLKLTKYYKKTKNQVQVYVSHHETGPPTWEEVSNAKYALDETYCVIFLKKFCWVKYEVNNKIVEAKRIRVYTAGKRLQHTDDTLAEIEVGYHWDLPIARENLCVTDNMFVYQSKPFIYVKEGNLPLEIFLTKTVPKQWKYITPEENPKVISFKCVANSKEKSCPFVITKWTAIDRVPFCMFKVQQGNEELELYIRFDE